MFEAFDLVAQLEDLLDALEVDTLGGELLDEPELFEVLVGVAAGPTGGPVRVEQTAPLVDAQRLGMDAAELGGHRDDVDGLGTFVVHGQAPRWVRGLVSVS